MVDKKQKKKDSKLSIVAAVMALFTFTIPVALILAIVDLIKSKGNRSQRHLGSYFAIIFSILMLIVVIDRNGNNNNADGINVTKQVATTEQNTDTVTYDNTTLKYLKHDVITDSNDREVLVVYFDFTNNSKDNTRAAYNYDINCFQNGVELDYPLLKVVEEEDNIMKEIQPNTTITIAEAFILNDRSNVDLEVEAHSSFIDKKLIKKTLTLE